MKKNTSTDTGTSIKMVYHNHDKRETMERTVTTTEQLYTTIKQAAELFQVATQTDTGAGEDEFSLRIHRTDRPFDIKYLHGNWYSIKQEHLHGMVFWTVTRNYHYDTKRAHHTREQAIADLANRLTQDFNTPQQEEDNQ